VGTVALSWPGPPVLVRPWSPVNRLQVVSRLSAPHCACHDVPLTESQTIALTCPLVAVSASKAARTCSEIFFSGHGSRWVSVPYSRAGPKVGPYIATEGSTRGLDSLPHQFQDFCSMTADRGYPFRYPASLARKSVLVERLDQGGDECLHLGLRSLISHPASLRGCVSWRIRSMSREQLVLYNLPLHVADDSRCVPQITATKYMTSKSWSSTCRFPAPWISSCASRSSLMASSSGCGCSLLKARKHRIT